MSGCLTRVGLVQACEEHVGEWDGGCSSQANLKTYSISLDLNPSPTPTKLAAIATFPEVNRRPAQHSDPIVTKATHPDQDLEFSE